MTETRGKVRSLRIESWGARTTRYSVAALAIGVIVTIAVLGALMRADEPVSRVETAGTIVGWHQYESPDTDLPPSPVFLVKLDTDLVVEARAHGATFHHGKRVMLQEQTMKSGRRLYRFVRYLDEAKDQ